MSTYQRLHFVACDRTLDDEQLTYMQGLSGHADVTRRSFDVAYHWGGGFRGTPEKMLRRGYDAHLEFASYGTRRAMFRLPGPPIPRSRIAMFNPFGSVLWHPDDGERAAGGPGLLELGPEDSDPDTFADGYDHDPSDAIAALPAIRDALLRGDPRPLTLGFLVGLSTRYGYEEDDGSVPLPPAPAGLANLPPALAALARFFALPSSLVAAAAEAAPVAAAPGEPDTRSAAHAFAAVLAEPDLRTLAAELLTGDSAAVAGTLRQRFRAETPTAAWPLRDDPRTPTALLARADELAAEATRARRAAEASRAKAEAARAAKARSDAVARVARDPEAELTRIESTIGTRTTAAYRENFDALAILHDALGEPAARRVFVPLAARLDAREKRPVGLIRMMREEGWIG